MIVIHHYLNISLLVLNFNIMKTEGTYFCPNCKISTYHILIFEFSYQILDYYEPSNFNSPEVLTCTECMCANTDIE